jgi:hypothetical protein
MKISLRTTAGTLERPKGGKPRTRVIPSRQEQSVHQIRDRVWRAKIRKVERIEAEEDRMWGLVAERRANDPNDESVPLAIVQRELGLDRPE